MTATTRETFEATSAIRPVRRPAPMSWLQAAMATLVGLCDRQRQRHALLELDARLLEDIGSSRADAAAEGRKPFWR